MKNYADKYDIVIVGSGTGGTPAAIAAARNGASVLVVEKNGFLGGLMTGGLISPWQHRLAKHVWEDLKEPYVEGIFTEILGRLRELGALPEIDGRMFWDEEVLKYVLEQMCLEAGVNLLLHSFVFRVANDERRLTSIEIANKSGVRSISGKVFIDGTGDADLAYLAGAKCEKGRELDGAMQPMSMTFRLGGVDTEKLPNRSPYWDKLKARRTGKLEMTDGAMSMHEEYLEAKKRGEITTPRNALFWWRQPRPGIIHFNSTWVQHVDGTKAEDLTEAEIKGKQQVIEILGFLKRFPAFANAYLIQMSSEIGVRDTRRIVGEYALTKEDVLGGKKFEDGIARGHAPINVHAVGKSMEDSTVIYCSDYTSYDIPYRCLIPEDLDNVLIASRCISCTHEALGSVRQQPSISAIGQAAGTAAALACRKNIPCSQLDVKLLRHTLREQGASIWQPGMPG